MNTLDPRALRDAFGRFMTGVTVVTALDADGKPVGFTANSFASVSLDPPLLLVCPGKFLSSYNTFAACERFCVSILGEGQEDVANTFAGYKGDRFAKVSHRLDPHGVPFVEGAIARFSCRTHKSFPVGDHSVLIGEVTAFEQEGTGGLGYAGGRFFSLGLERRERSPSAASNVAGALVHIAGQMLLERTSDGYRLPDCVIPDKTSLRQTLAGHLASQGVTARLGVVYSVFDDPGKDAHYAYLLAEAVDLSKDCGLELVPIFDLPRIDYECEAQASMLTRFADETACGAYALYLGNAKSGEIHALKAGA